MPTSRGATHGLAGLLFLSLVLAVFLTACELSVEEPQGARDEAQRSALSVGVASLPAYDVAVSATDFDPPLRRETLSSSTRSVKLMAAIENRGTMPLTRVVVEARISSHKGDFSAQDWAQIDKLSPGETRVVEFAGVEPVTTIPRSPSYQILVSARSQQPDANPQNNNRELIVRVAE